MTRREEIEQASNLVFKIKLCQRTAFIRGAEWADRHPREGLVDVEKACNWISVYFEKSIDKVTMDYIIAMFRKAMED